MTTMKHVLVYAAVAAFAGIGCGEREAESGGGVAQTYAPELNVEIGGMTRSPAGLHTKDITTGTGATAEAGQVVIVHYTGWLPTGEQFESSRDVGHPYVFPLGAGRVISGWDEGIAGMKVGGRRQLVIPPHLAYGSTGSGPIPPYATLVFDVELLGIQGVDEPAAPPATDTVPPDTTVDSDNQESS